MKENFERIFKEQLESYELPYDNGAWEQFSKRLDGTPSTPFYRKWWFAASVGTVLVGSATYFAWSSGNTTGTDAIQAPVARMADESPVAANGTTPGTGASSSQTGTGSANTGHNTPDQGNTLIWTPENNTTAPGQDRTHENTFAGIQKELDKITTTPPFYHTQGTSSPAYIRFDVPSAVCLNESFTVKNPNEVPMSVTLPNGRTKVIAARQSAEIKASEAGKIVVQSGNQSEVIVINEAISNLIVDVDASLLYDNGIPTIKFNVLNADNSVFWTSNVDPNSQSVVKNELTVHPFNDREVMVIAHNTDQNGCPVSEKKTITLEQTYNLLAPTGFDPSSSDERNNKFIPYALLLRDTPFEMVIMDAKTMATVYRTTDASQGWDGTDSRTGQVAAPGSTWLWKVILKAPQPGEKSQYSGVVTRVNGY
jgi:hypothetical protein